jgi:hypothetical protein
MNSSPTENGQTGDTHPKVGPAYREFQLRDLPQGVLDEATREAGNFATFIVAGDALCGSATFVMLGDCPGLLTARHVWDLANERSKPDGLIGFSIADDPHCYQVRKETLVPMNLVSRRSDEFGPDIEFIRLAPAHVSAIRTRRSFYNLSIDPVGRKAKALSPVGFSLIAGFPDEEAKSHPGKYGFQALTEQVGIGLISGVDRRFEKDGFDYLELAVSYKPPARSPKSFGGVSGAGIWQFPVGKKLEEPMSATRYKDFYLIGVAFYQSPIADDGRFIRAHGQATIYDFLTSKASDFGRPAANN